MKDFLKVPRVGVKKHANRAKSKAKNNAKAKKAKISAEGTNIRKEKLLEAQARVSTARSSTARAKVQHIKSHV